MVEIVLSFVVPLLMVGLLCLLFLAPFWIWERIQHRRRRDMLAEFKQSR